MNIQMLDIVISLKLNYYLNIKHVHNLIRYVGLISLGLNV